jgi:uncharacterized membrane protein
MPKILKNTFKTVVKKREKLLNLENDRKIRKPNGGVVDLNHFSALNCAAKAGCESGGGVWMREAAAGGGGGGGDAWSRA